jgi:hypothetical protein
MRFIDNRALEGGDTALDVRKILDSAIGKGKASLTLKNKDIVRLTEMDVREKDKIAILLFRRSDPEAATPIFEDDKTRALRKSDKKPRPAQSRSSRATLTARKSRSI